MVLNTAFICLSEAFKGVKRRFRRESIMLPFSASYRVSRPIMERVNSLATFAQAFLRKHICAKFAQIKRLIQMSHIVLQRFGNTAGVHWIALELRVDVH